MQRADFLNRLPKLETLKEAANLGFEHAKKIIQSGDYNLVILDEN